MEMVKTALRTQHFTSGTASGCGGCEYEFVSGFANAPSSGMYATDPSKLGPLGRNPGKVPDGYDWKGKPNSIPGSKDGSYVHPDGSRLRPDLDHPGPIGPHWDHWPSKNGPKTRLDPDSGEPIPQPSTMSIFMMMVPIIMLMHPAF